MSPWLWSIPNAIALVAFAIVYRTNNRLMKQRADLWAQIAEKNHLLAELSNTIAQQAAALAIQNATITTKNEAILAAQATIAHLTHSPIPGSANDNDGRPN